MGAAIKEASDEQRLAIVDQLAAGDSLENVAARLRLALGVVREVAHAHGYPNRDSMARAVIVLERNAEARGGQRPAPTGNGFEVFPSATNLVERDTLADLVVAGKKSELARTRALAEKLEQIAADLRTRIADESKAKREADRLAKEQAEAKAEVARLEEALRAAKARAGGKVASATPNSTRAGDGPAIRAWARQNGYELGNRGVIPTNIIDAWKAAQ